MDQLESPPARRTGVLVLILVLLGVGAVGIGGYLMWSRQQANGADVEVSAEVGPWCKVRQEWAKAVDPLVGDILLKSVRPEDKDEHERLVVKRNTICQEHARKVRDLAVTDPLIQAVEEALIREGKTRANITVETHNLLAKIDVDESAGLNSSRDKLEKYIDQRIKQGRATADQEINAALAKVGGCAGIYRGPMTDEGTADNPYASWDELEMQRTKALKQVDEKIRELEPQEQFANQVYHEMVRLYRPWLMTCHKRAKAINSQMSDKLGLRVRLKGTGEVATLAIEWMDNREDKFLDCLLEKAAKWKLPRPAPGMNVVVVTLDLSRL